MRINRPDIILFSCASLLLGFHPCIAQLQSSTPPYLAGLTYAIEDIIKLSHAGISEPVIINYIESSGTLYDLKPQDVIHLRDEGVTDGVINAMIDQRRKFQTVQTNAAPPVAEAPVAPTQPTVQVTVSPCPRYCGVCRGPLVTCQEPVSTLYIIPYSSTQRTYRTYQNWGPYHYYGSYGYYGSWQRPFHGPRLYRCGHWHECSHGH